MNSNNLTHKHRSGLTFDIANAIGYNISILMLYLPAASDGSAEETYKLIKYFWGEPEDVEISELDSTIDTYLENYSLKTINNWIARQSEDN